jgi:hypothetical protein
MCSSGMHVQDGDMIINGANVVTSTIQCRVGCRSMQQVSEWRLRGAVSPFGGGLGGGGKGGEGGDGGSWLYSSAAHMGVVR